MTDYVRLDEPVFEASFRPLRDAGGGWREFDWTIPSDLRTIREATAEHRIWTIVDVDGFVLLTAGWHFVNRLGYVVTDGPFPAGAEIDVYDEEEYEEWQERCLLSERLGLEVPMDIDELRRLAT